MKSKFQELQAVIDQAEIIQETNKGTDFQVREFEMYGCTVHIYRSGSISVLGIPPHVVIAFGGVVIGAPYDGRFITARIKNISLLSEDL